jgi:SAM-dependent methyltransferase
VDLPEWLQENMLLIDWKLFAEPWNAMQRRHNPFRDEQIDAILQMASVDSRKGMSVLDLGCGPGILGSRILKNNPEAHYFGADGDPLMLAAMQVLLPRNRVHPINIDLRTTGWILNYIEKIDVAVSLTALHWLSKTHMKNLFTSIFKVLKPGGRLIVGDPYLPENAETFLRLKAIQEERIAREKGQTWGEFWAIFFEKYPIKDLYTEYHKVLGYQEPFEGSDDGYPIEFYMGALNEAGFHNASVYWTSGLRIVYGGTKTINKNDSC